MGDRFLMWLGAGVVTAGMSAAMLAGTGVAIADDGSSSDTGGTTSSETSGTSDRSRAANSADGETDSSSGGVAGARTTGGGAVGTRPSTRRPTTRVGATTPVDTKHTANAAAGAQATNSGGEAKRPVGKKGEDGTVRDGTVRDGTVSDAAAKEPKQDEKGAGKGADGGAAGQQVTGEQTTVDAGGEQTTDESVTDEVADEAATTDAAGDQLTDQGADQVTDEVVMSTGSDREHTVAQKTAAVALNAAANPSNDDTTARTGSEKRAVVDTEIDNPVTQDVAAERTTVALEKAVDNTLENTEEFAVQAVAFASAPLAATTATAPGIPNILRVIGTIVFDLYAIATRILGGPPILPPNSTVTVRSSTLRIDCGCAVGEGEEVPADWYIPKTEEGAPPPDRLVYLQHGFLASAPWYSHTAAALAESTNSIVVAPSITSNFFAADACWLGGSSMHEAMAGLFDEENDALAESARAAGYTGPIPDRVVLMGHSLGGGAVSGMAGHMVDDETIDRLAGVVLLDGVALGDPARMTASLKKVPADIPIYQLAAPVYMWNNFGSGIEALLAARPGEFVGVTLVNGSHVDTMRGGNPLIQFAQELVAGFTRPENAAAAQTLMIGWVNDMFAGTKESGLYLDLGEPYSFETPAGTATVVALPNGLTKPFLLNFLQPFMSLADGIFTFDPVCVRESVGTAGAGGCSDSIAA